MDSTSQAPILWGKSKYPFPGQFLGTGNRCGHDPEKPDWDRFNQPETKKALPHTMRKLMDGIREYYKNPWMLPTLANLSCRKNMDGNPRQNRTEAREAESLVMSAIIAMTEFSSLRVGTPLPNGDFIHRSCGEIAQVAGLTDPSSDPENPEPSQRFWRAFRRLKLAGAFKVHRQYEVKPDGSKRARPAIKNLNMNFLVSFGVVGYTALKKFRTWCSNQLKKKRRDYAEKHPERGDAAAARKELQKEQVLGGLLTAHKANRRTSAIADANAKEELKHKYNIERVDYYAQLKKNYPDRHKDWIMSELNKRYPDFEIWVQKIKRQ